MMKTKVVTAVLELIIELKWKLLYTIRDYSEVRGNLGSNNSLKAPRIIKVCKGRLRAISKPWNLKVRPFYEMFFSIPAS